MLLSELLSHQLPASIDRPVIGLALDSRAVRPGEVFFALAGTQTHGELYINSALQKGAIAVLKEAPTAGIEILHGDIACISQPNLSEQIGEIAARFYDYPSRNMHIIGVTGTNGKTSVTHAIAALLQAHAPCGLLGTLGYGIYGELQLSEHTTPDAIHLQTLLAQLRAQNVQNVAMEVSSHALAQGRVNGITFKTAVLTNLSRDHLDYHHTMAAYGDAKRRLFTWPHLKTAVINHDDGFGQSVLANLPQAVTPLTYSLVDKNADVYAQIRAYDIHGYQLDIYTHWGNAKKLHSPWLGQFNISNVLAGLTVLLNMGYPLPELLTQLSTLRPVPGRMERFGQAHQPTVVVDYAHTPDALEKVLLVLREHLKGIDSGGSVQGLLWCVFGCGGSRDQGKRRLMGEVAQRYANKIIITDDNPRHEASTDIINDILQGCPTPTAVIQERQQAIRYALQGAGAGDVVLIAGKGHEEYQQVGEQRLPFSDRTLVSLLLNY